MILKRPFFYVLIILIRLAAITLIIFYPLEGILISILLDLLDGWFWAFSGLPKSKYHEIDKPIDYLTHCFELVAASRTVIFYPLLVLFLYRSIGHLIYWFTKNKRVFIFFPNLFEYFFIIYLVIERFRLDISIFDWRIIAALILFKLCQEIYVHMFPLDTAYRLVPVFQKSLNIK